MAAGGGVFLPEDVTAHYKAQSESRIANQDVSEMESFLASARAGEKMEVAPLAPGDPPPRPLPVAPPLRRKTDDTLGRLPPPNDKEKKSAVSRNVAEVPGAAIAGVESAINNAMGWAINPLAEWLNENVANLSYDRKQPETPTGKITKSISEFLTGFIPALKGLRAAGATGNVAAPMVAGAFADFAARDPSEPRLADLWNQLGLPKNVLTDYLSSKPDDSQMEARFKNAIEGAGLGVVAEGIFLGARMIRHAKNIRGAKQTETAYLKDKYGEVTEETFTKIIGDPSLPSVELKVHTPSKVGAKVEKGLEETEKLAPRSVIRNKAKPITEDSVQKSLPIADRGVRYGGKVYRASGDETHIAAVQRLVKDLGDTKIDVNKMETGIITPDGKFLTHAENESGKFGLFRDNTKGVSYHALQAEVARRKAKTLDFEVYINFAKFDEPDQIKFAIGKMAEAGKGTIDESTRGVITQAETERLAENMGMTVTDLLARRKGQGFNAEEAVAARQLWAASAERLVELAKTAAGKNAGPLDQYAFRKQMAVHHAIQAEVIGARTETARALASWKIPVKGGIERARAIDQIMNAMGGPQVSNEMARRLAILAEINADPAVIAKFVEKGMAANSLDAIREVWINGLLSSPKTHVVNTMSNTLVAFASIVEREAAAGIRALTGGEGVQAIEGAAMTFGMVMSIREAFRMSAKALKTGETSWTFNKVDLPQSHALSPEAFGMSRDTAVGRFVDYIGTAARVPTRLLGAEDEFFKTIGYRMELYAQAARMAKQEGHSGYEFGKRVAEIVQNPPEHVMINSADAALYNTFTNEVGNFGRSVLNLRENVPISTFVLPFVRTPVNIARYAFERTPFAPLVAQWRADIAAGGARADLALARMSTGTAIMLTAMDFADKGFITGSGVFGGKEAGVTESMQRQGWMPYSVKIGDRWYSYNRTDPFGMTMGFAASIAEAVKRGEISEDQVDEWHEVTAMAIAAISQVVVSKTYLEGFSNFVETMSDPKRYSQKYIDDLFASFLPLTSLSAAVKNVVDPTQREVQSPREAVMARIATLSEQLPPRRDLWGQPIISESGLGKGYDFLSPIASKEHKDSPIDKEMVRLNHGVARLRKQTSFDGVMANMRFYPKVYDDYTRLAGNDLKHPAWGMGAKDYLNAVVSGKHAMSTAYNILSDESRKAFIQNTVQEYRKLAQREILGNPKHSAFAAEIKRLKEIHQGSRMPVLGE